MFDLESLRPLIEGVQDLVYSELNKTLVEGETLEWRPDKAGWVQGVLGAFNTPLIEVTENLWGQEIITTVTAWQTLIDDKLVNDHFTWVGKSSAVTPIYTLMYTPRPYKYYRKGSYIKLKAPTGGCVVYAFQVYYLEIDDVDVLRRSIKELFGVI